MLRSDWLHILLTLGLQVDNFDEMATALKRCVYTYGVPGQGMPAI